jgi:hypothetical protein
MAYITRLSLRFGVVVLLGVALLFGGGIFAATQVQQDLLPDISIPAVLVVTPYPGASPQVVDGQVTVPIVNAMQGVTGSDTIQSTSSQGSSLVIVLFRDGTDLKSAVQDVNAALSRIRPLLPSQATNFTVQTFSTNSLPILVYAVSADEELGDLAGQLRASALPKLKGLAGVSSVNMTGAPTDEVDVTLDPLKLAANGVTVSQVATALQQASIVASIGSIKDGSATIPLLAALGGGGGVGGAFISRPLANVVIGLVTLAAASAAGAITGIALDPGNLAAASLGMIPLGLLIAAIGYLASGWLRAAIDTGLISFLLVFWFFLSFVAPELQWPDATLRLSAFYYYGTPLLHGLQVTGTIGLLAVGALALAAASARFVRKDIGV